LRGVDFGERILWQKIHAYDLFLHGGSGKHKLRYEHHTELGGGRSGEHYYHAGDIHVHIAERFNEHEPNGDDHLYPGGNQCRRLDYVCGDRYRKSGKQTSDQLVHSQPHDNHFRIQQHAELGDDGSDQYCHHSGIIHFHVREWIDERESNGDNYLHSYCHQCRWLDHLHGEGDCNSVRWSVGDHNHIVPRRDPRRGVCRVHNRR
jgi:hypothetical protein